MLWVMGGYYTESVSPSATPIFQVLFHKTSSPKALKPLSPQALMPSNLQTHKFSNLQGLKQNSQFPSSTQTLKPSCTQAQKPSNPQIVKPTNPQANIPQSPQSLSSNPEALKSSSPQALKLQNPRTLHWLVGYTNLKFLTPSLLPQCCEEAYDDCLAVWAEILASAGVLRMADDDIQHIQLTHMND